MKELYLNSVHKSKPNYKKFVTLVDDEDYEMLSQYNWSLKEQNHTNYVHGFVNGKRVKLHRFLLGAKDGEVVDHIDGNGLNNQRKNIRICTQSQNMKNKKAQGKSKYVGVISRAKSKCGSVIWVAQARIEGRKSQHIGSYKTEIEAAIAHDIVVLKHNGEFARLNFPCIRLWK